MRSLLIMAMLTASLAHATYRDYTEVRDLQLDAADIKHLTIDAGAGPISVQGVRGSDKILVKATITVADTDADDAREAYAVLADPGPEERRESRAEE